MLVLATVLMAGISGCDVLHDDLSGCELTLQFRYDYTMEGKDRKKIASRCWKRCPG